MDSSSNLKSIEIDQQYFKDGNFKVVNIDSSYHFEWYDKNKNRYISLLRDADTFKTTFETLPFHETIKGFAVQWSLYINSVNKYYLKMPNSDTVKWTDGSLNHDSIISIYTYKNVAKILGYNCDEIVMICTNGIKKFYYSTSNFKVNSKQFIKYKSGNWTDFLLMTNSLPLMQIEQSDKSYTEIVAIKAEKMKLDEEFFKLPKNLIISKVGN